MFTFRAIKKLKINSAGGPDGIKPVFLKNTVRELFHPLTILFETFFHSSYVPNIWRTAHFTPVFKNGDPTLPSNYRPISLTCICSKIMETIIKDQLMYYLMDNKLITKHQHAFFTPLNLYSTFGMY